MLTEDDRYHVYLLGVFYMAYSNEYNRQNHRDFPCPIFSLSKAWIFTFGEKKRKKKTGVVVWKVGIQKGFPYLRN